MHLLDHVGTACNFDPKGKPTGFQEGDWVRVEFDWAGFSGEALAGEVVRVGQKFTSGVYNLDLKIPADAACRAGETIAVPAEYCKFLGFPVAVDDNIDEFINQGLRECYVVEVAKTRFRMEWEMPKTGVQGGWRTGARVPGYTQLFYPCGQMRVAPQDETPLDLDAFIRSRTGFESLEDMINAPGNYEPTIHIHEDPRFLKLANAYDEAQRKRNDPRRAFRS